MENLKKNRKKKVLGKMGGLSKKKSSFRAKKGKMFEKKRVFGQKMVHPCQKWLNT